MSFVHAMERVAQGIEVFAVTVLVLGMVWSVISSALVWRTSRDGRVAYRRLREMIGGALLLGVEILVAADLIRTVAVTPTLESVLVLGAIVLIRTFLSFSLEVEIEGVPPWRRALLTSGAEVLARSTRRSANAPEGDTRR